MTKTNVLMFPVSSKTVVGKLQRMTIQARKGDQTAEIFQELFLGALAKYLTMDLQEALEKARQTFSLEFTEDYLAVVLNNALQLAKEQYMAEEYFYEGDE